VKTAL